jgi:alcohol dehydrogenase YqhD (iron-dependent ADH family)
MEGYQTLLTVLFSALFLVIAIVIIMGRNTIVILGSTHSPLIKALAEQVNISKKEAAEFVLEVGFASLIASRKIVDGREGIVAATSELCKTIEKDENVSKMAELLEIWHEKEKK